MLKLFFITKITRPTKINEFESISLCNIVLAKKKSLCNIVYKIISKVLTNRLKPIMDLVISLSEWVISDNIVLASELMHFIHQAKRNQPFWAALKLDMAKTYDNLSWSFIEVVLIRMRFPP